MPEQQMGHDMLEITLYQVWSRIHPFKDNEPCLHDTRTKWNMPEDARQGAIGLRDDVMEEFYDRGIHAWVWIKEVTAEVDEQHLVIT
jgi:hypothetical protein